jgi:hypothetical protein
MMYHLTCPGINQFFGVEADRNALVQPCDQISFYKEILYENKGIFLKKGQAVSFKENKGEVL